MILFRNDDGAIRWITVLRNNRLQIGSGSGFAHFSKPRSHHVIWSMFEPAMTSSVFYAQPSFG
jgi:hypothetical protein